MYTLIVLLPEQGTAGLGQGAAVELKNVADENPYAFRFVADPLWLLRAYNREWKNGQWGNHHRIRWLDGNPGCTANLIGPGGALSEGVTPSTGATGRSTGGLSGARSRSATRPSR